MIPKTALKTEMALTAHELRAFFINVNEQIK